MKLKLKEEVEEFLRESSNEELADILEVIDSIKHFLNVEDKELFLVKEKKFNEKRGFKERIILDEVKNN